MPGNMRRADHFINFMKRIIVFFKNIMKSKDVRKFSPINFLEELNSLTQIDKRPLQFVADRLNLLLNTL
jgi:DNA excision repair protein ERCC-2